MKKLLLFGLFFLLGMNVCNASVDTASQYILMDATTGRVIKGKNYNTPMLIASITKIMTCLLAVESGKLDEIVVVDDVILDSYGSGIYIEVGEEISLRDLLYGLMLESGNDAAVALAEYYSGSVEAFAKVMNDEAKKIGATKSNFVNPSGYPDDNHYTTIYDMYLIFAQAINLEKFTDVINSAEHTANYKDVNGKWVELVLYDNQNTITVNYNDNIFIGQYATIKYVAK